MYITQEEIDNLYKKKKEGRVIIRIKEESSFNIKNEKGIVKWIRNKYVFENNKYKQVKEHYVFYPDNKVKFGKNIFVVKEEEIEWLE